MVLTINKRRNSIPEHKGYIVKNRNLCSVLDLSFYESAFVRDIVKKIKSVYVCMYVRMYVPYHKPIINIESYPTIIIYKPIHT